MKGSVFLLLNVLALGGLLGSTVRSGVPSYPLVDVVPLGNVDDEVLQATLDALSTQTRLPIRLTHRRSLPFEALDAASGRFHADTLLDVLDDELADSAWKTVFVTEAPLSVADDPFDRGLVGMGAVRGRACVISAHSFLLRSGTAESLHRRVEGLVLHELGHALGLRHCGAPGCVMRASQGDAVAWADLQRGGWCVLCRMKLGEDVVPIGPTTPPSSSLATLVHTF